MACETCCGNGDFTVYESRLPAGAARWMGQPMAHWLSYPDGFFHGQMERIWVWPCPDCGGRPDPRPAVVL